MIKKHRSHFASVREQYPYNSPLWPRDYSLHGEAFNFSAEKPYTVIEVVQAIQKLLPETARPPVILDVAQDEIESQYLDSSKARRRLGWSATFTLEDGLHETIAWYRELLGNATPARVG